MGGKDLNLSRVVEMYSHITVEALVFCNYCKPPARLRMRNPAGRTRVPEHIFVQGWRKSHNLADPAVEYSIDISN